jgi:hypothetical protein
MTEGPIEDKREIATTYQAIVQQRQHHQRLTTTIGTIPQKDVGCLLEGDPDNHCSLKAASAVVTFSQIGGEAANT